MTGIEIKKAVSEALKSLGPAAEGQNYLAVRCDSVHSVKINKSTDCNVGFVRLTDEQIYDGFSPRGWKAIMEKIIKIQDSMK